MAQIAERPRVRTRVRTGRTHRPRNRRKCAISLNSLGQAARRLCLPRPLPRRNRSLLVNSSGSGASDALARTIYDLHPLWSPRAYPRSRRQPSPASPAARLSAQPSAPLGWTEAGQLLLDLVAEPALRVAGQAVGQGLLGLRARPAFREVARPEQRRRFRLPGTRQSGTWSTGRPTPRHRSDFPPAGRRRPAARPWRAGARAGRPAAPRPETGARGPCRRRRERSGRRRASDR